MERQLHYLNQTRQMPGIYDPERWEYIQAFVPEPDEMFSLPPSVTKSKAVNIASQALLKLGGNSTDVTVLNKIAETTARDSWHSRTKAPINWRRQVQMAKELSLSARQFRNCEMRLEQFGVVARTTADNGYRGRRAGQKCGTQISCGLSLEPLIANHHAHTLVLAEWEQQEEQRLTVVHTIRTTKHRIHKLIKGIADIETHRWAENAYEELKEKIPKKGLRNLDEAKLDDIYTSLIALLRRIREAMRPLDTNSTVAQGNPEERDGSPITNMSAAYVDSHSESSASPTSSTTDYTRNSRDFSGAEATNFPCHIQPERESLESCNEPSSTKSPSADADDRNSFDCREKKIGDPSDWINPSVLKKINEDTVVELASDDMTGWLKTFDDWRDALPHILRDLEINMSAWHDAVDVLGDGAALIALIVIDRNRFHPDYPIKSPGGTLRAFTRAALKGELNLTQSIIGIWDRDRKGRQQRSKPQQNNSPAPESTSQSPSAPSGSSHNQPGNAQIASNPLPANTRGRKPSSCRERRGGTPADWITPDILDKLTPDTIRQLATHSAAHYLDECEKWEDAVPHIVKELRLNNYTYNDAVEIMGEYVTFIALLVIDRNRFRTNHPVTHPDRTLGFFNKLAGSDSDKLNLSNAITDIWARERDGMQPRGPRKKSPPPKSDTLPTTQPPELVPDNQPCSTQNTSESPPDDDSSQNGPESSMNVERSNDWISPELLPKLNREIFGKLDPETIQQLASENVAHHLKACEDWRAALPHILQELNINSMVWANAVTVLGKFAAFITLIVVDRNRFRPHDPVTHPAAALEKHFQNARRGNFDLTQVIADIWERERKGEHPRALPDGKKVQ